MCHRLATVALLCSVRFDVFFNSYVSILKLAIFCYVAAVCMQLCVLELSLVWVLVES